MPVPKINWQELNSRASGDTFLYALTDAQATILQSISEVLTWRNPWRTHEYDFSDWDTLQAEIADLQNNLAMPVSLVDLFGYIDEVEDLLRALQHLSGCCPDADLSAGDEYTDVVVDGEGTVPQNIVDSGYVVDEDDWTGFADYKCAISHLLIDHMEQVLRQIVPYIDDTGVIIGGVGTVAGVISGILAAAGGPFVLGILAAVGIAAGLWTLIISYGDELTEGLADKVATNHDELACAVYEADGLTSGIQALKDKIDELFTGPEALILKNTNLDPILKAMYSGRYDQQNIAQRLADRGIDTGDYDCSCEVSYEVQFEYDFDDGRQNWTYSSRCEYHAQGAWCNVEQAGIMFNSNGTTAAVADDSIQDMFDFFSLDPVTGSARFYVQNVRFYWRPCPEINKTAFIKLGVTTYEPEDYDREVAGFYEKSWSSGNEPQLVQGDNCGIYCPTQGDPAGPTTFGYVYSFRMSGFVAEAS